MHSCAIKQAAATFLAAPGDAIHPHPGATPQWLMMFAWRGSSAPMRIIFVPSG